MKLGVCPHEASELLSQHGTDGFPSSSVAPKPLP